MRSNGQFAVRSIQLKRSSSDLGGACVEKQQAVHQQRGTSPGLLPGVSEHSAMGSGSTAWLRHHVQRDRIWRLVDARDQILGRVATQIATVLIGKNKPTYLDNIFSGDPVVVINARHFALTGRKARTKVYTHHTGTPGGLKKVPVQRVLETRPTDPIRLAVKRMMAPNRLRSVRLDNLHIYPDENHPHESQKPVLLPPAHAGKRLGCGLPPNEFELKNWWLEHLCAVPDALLEETVSAVRAECAAEKVADPPAAVGVGLASLLDYDMMAAADAKRSNSAAAAAAAAAAETRGSWSGGGVQDASVAYDAVGLPADNSHRESLQAYIRAAARDHAQPTYPITLPPGMSA
jgi:large subunit ribosomal protein L13